MKGIWPRQCYLGSLTIGRLRKRPGSAFATVNIRGLIEPRDLWIGAYWACSRSVESAYWRLKLYLCILPMLPVLFDVESIPAKPFGVRS